MERYDDGFAEERQRIERLVEEIIAGEHKIDKLPNSSAGFSGAAQAVESKSNCIIYKCNAEYDKRRYGESFVGRDRL